MNDKNNQIIKNDVKPILTSIQKIRYKQASNHFIHGMSKHVQEFVKNIKELVDVKQVKSSYQKHYTQSAKNYVKRFNSLRKQVNDQKNKIIKPLLIIIGGAYLFKKAMQAAQKKFSKQMEVFKAFVGDIYQLGKMTSDILLQHTKLWSIRVFGTELDIGYFLSQCIKNIPSFILGTFNFICHGLDWFLNNSNLFQDILIDVALRGYNASFQTSWGWVLGLVLDRAQQKKRTFISTSGFARFGSEFQQIIAEQNKLYESALSYSVRGFWGQKSWLSEKTKMTTVTWTFSEENAQEVLGIYNPTNIITMLGEGAYNLYYGYSTNLLDYFQSHIPQFNAHARRWGVTIIPHGAHLNGDDRDFYFSQMKAAAQWVDNKENRKKSVQQLGFMKLRDNPYIKKINQKMIALQEKYDFDFENDLFLKNIQTKRIQMLNNAWDIPQNVYFFYALYLSILSYFKQRQERQLLVKGIRYHSRFQYSNVDALHDNIFNTVENLKTQNEVDRFYRLYNDGVWGFQDYLKNIIKHLQIIASNKGQNNFEGFSNFEMDNLRRLWNFGKIHSLLIDIKHYFNSLSMKSENDLYFQFSDSFSDDVLTKNAQGLYLNLYKPRERMLDKDGKPMVDMAGNQMWSLGIDVGKDGQSTLGTKAKLQYLVGQIINGYVQLTKYKKKRRQYRCKLIEIMKEILFRLRSKNNDLRSLAGAKTILPDSSWVDDMQKIKNSVGYSYDFDKVKAYYNL